MDGRDAFLTMAREKQYEFSSLRRCKYSTLVLVYELHTQVGKSFFFVGTRFHSHRGDLTQNRKAIFFYRYAFSDLVVMGCVGFSGLVIKPIFEDNINLRV